jgi:hypothetical protein
MKTMRRAMWPAQRGHLVVLLSLGLASSSLAQSGSPTNTFFPVVMIQATDPNASWSGDPGTFTVFRAGDPAQLLNVYYRILGTASNGVDYKAIGNYVQIPSGVYSNTVVINPINNGQTTTKTVTLQLAPSPTMQPVNYVIGYPSNATVFIRPLGTTNIPPFVNIGTPTNGAIFYTPADIPICANAADPDGYVATVEFFAGTNSLGITTNNPASAGPRNPFCLIWSNAPAGTYELTAVATDNGGASTTSDPVNFSVLSGPPTNLPPVVRIFSPTNGSTFYTPVDIRLFAAATDPDGSISNVEFFAGTTDLGPGLPLVLDPPGVNGIVGLVYFLNWTNVAAGSYPLTAVATDNGGASTVSPIVNITVLPGPPPTNFPPVVRVTSPPNGSTFRAPVDIPIFAYAFDPDGAVTSVEFFADGTSLGFGHRISPPVVLGAPYGGPIPPITPSNIWVLVWSNAPPGTNIALTADATDNGGASTISSPVHITILPPLPPPTNRPPIVSIIASDPVAIEGTNCWPWLGLAGVPPTWSNWTAPTAVCRFFTNCGPKNATFTVRRFGDTNGDLTVTYAIGGTATNGLEYVALPGVITIPAGERHASISVVPIDDGPPDITSTVVLKLTPSTNSPPDYLLGFPRNAAAIILDPGPRPVTGVLPDKCFHLAAAGPDGAWFHVEYSTDLQSWTSICAGQVINGSIDFVDPDAPGDQQRLYRAVPEADPPPE